MDAGIHDKDYLQLVVTDLKSGKINEANGEQSTSEVQDNDSDYLQIVKDGDANNTVGKYTIQEVGNDDNYLPVIDDSRDIAQQHSKVGGNETSHCDYLNGNQTSYDEYLQMVNDDYDVLKLTTKNSVENNYDVLRTNQVQLPVMLLNERT